MAATALNCPGCGAPAGSDAVGVRLLRLDAHRAADAMRDAARNPNGAAASGAGIGIGFAVAQQSQQAQQMAAQPGRPTPGSAAVQEPPPLPHADWFHVVVSGERRGPLDPAALRQLVREGTLTGDTLVWRPGMATWTPASRVVEIATLLAE